MSSPDIINTIMNTMEQAEQVVNASGETKRRLALKLIKEELGELLYDRYYFLICGVIDFIVKVSKNGLDTTINSIRKDARKFFCCN